MNKYLNRYEYNIEPAPVTEVDSRSECIPYYDTQEYNLYLPGIHLPLFTAPMACVVDDKNYLEFYKHNIIPIIPRTVSFEKRLELMKEQVWIAVGLDEFEKFLKCPNDIKDAHVCIDIANGHMRKLINLCELAKIKYGSNITLMAGNVANQGTYWEFAKAGIDYIRLGIGSGGACLTNKLTGIGVEKRSLLNNIKYAKSEIDYQLNNRKNKEIRSVPKIIYDGGCESVRDVIVTLAMGADYVMCGQIFTQAEEAAGEILYKEDWVTKTFITEKDGKKYFVESKAIEEIPGRMYYGMSTERAQREMGKTDIKLAEGTETWVPIKYTLNEWTEQFTFSLRSAMSYCNAKTLKDFIGKPMVRN